MSLRTLVTAAAGMPVSEPLSLTSWPMLPARVAIAGTTVGLNSLVRTKVAAISRAWAGVGAGCSPGVLRCERGLRDLRHGDELDRVWSAGIARFSA